MTTTAAHEAVGAIASLEALDEPARKVGKTVRDAVPAGPVKDALSGTWLGHALHPVLTDLPIGAWTSAVLLDWLGGEASRDAADPLRPPRRAARRGRAVRRLRHVPAPRLDLQARRRQHRARPDRVSAACVAGPRTGGRD